jgi:hypothetical protein
VSIQKRILTDIRREAERQGATVTEGAKGMRVKGPSGLIIVHRSPSRPEVYRLSLPKNLLAVGIRPPEGGWKF